MKTHSNLFILTIVILLTSSVGRAEAQPASKARDNKRIEAIVHLRKVYDNDRKPLLELATADLVLALEQAASQSTGDTRLTEMQNDANQIGTASPDDEDAVCIRLGNAIIVIIDGGDSPLIAWDDIDSSLALRILADEYIIDCELRERCSLLAGISTYLNECHIADWRRYEQMKRRVAETETRLHVAGSSRTSAKGIAKADILRHLSSQDKRLLGAIDPADAQHANLRSETLAHIKNRSHLITQLAHGDDVVGKLASSFTSGSPGSALTLPHVAAVTPPQSRSPSIQDANTKTTTSNRTGPEQSLISACKAALERLKFHDIRVLTTEIKLPQSFVIYQTREHGNDLQSLNFRWEGRKWDAEGSADVGEIKWDEFVSRMHKGSPTFRVWANPSYRIITQNGMGYLNFKNTSDQAFYLNVRGTFDGTPLSTDVTVNGHETGRWSSHGLATNGEGIKTGTVVWLSTFTADKWSTPKQLTIHAGDNYVSIPF